MKRSPRSGSLALMPRLVYTPQIAEEILTRLANGETLVGICKSEHMPTPKTVWLWCDQNPQFATEYARARELHALFREHQISEETRQMTVENMAVAREKIHSLQWLAIVNDRKRYGDKSYVPPSEPEGNFQGLVISPEMRDAIVELLAPIVNGHPQVIEGTLNEVNPEVRALAPVVDAPVGKPAMAKRRKLRVKTAKEGFDKTRYQREYMKRRRAEKPVDNA